MRYGRDRLIAAVRPGHPLGGSRPAPERYAAAEHLTVSRRGSLRDPVDDALAAHGPRRRVVAAGPTAAFALQLALTTDLVVGRAAHPSRLSAADTSVRTPGRSTGRSGANRGLWFPGTLPIFSARSAPGAASHTGGGVDVTYQKS